MSLRIKVLTGAPDDKEPKEKRVDWFNRSDRKWLNDHMMWAMCNGQVVALIPDMDDVAKRSANAA